MTERAPPSQIIKTVIESFETGVVIREVSGSVTCYARDPQIKVYFEDTRDRTNR